MRQVEYRNFDGTLFRFSSLGDRYEFDISEPHNTVDYIIFKDEDGTVYAKNGRTGEYELEGVAGKDDGWLIDEVLDRIKAGGSIFLKRTRREVSRADDYDFIVDRTLTIRNEAEYATANYVIKSDGARIKYEGDANSSLLYVNQSPYTSGKCSHVVLEGFRANVYFDYHGKFIDLSNANKVTVRDVHIYANGYRANTNSEGFAIDRRGGNGVLFENTTAGAFYSNYNIDDDHVVLLRVSSTYHYMYGINIYTGYADVMIINPHVLRGYVDPNSIGIRIHAYYEGQAVLVNPYFERPSLSTYQRDIGLLNLTHYGVVVINPEVPASASTRLRIQISGNRNLAKIISHRTHKVKEVTFSGDGTTTQFTIPLDKSDIIILDVTNNDLAPRRVRVTPKSADAANPFFVTYDANNIYVNYLSPPPAGTDNIVLEVEYEW